MIRALDSLGFTVSAWVLEVALLLSRDSVGSLVVVVVSSVAIVHIVVPKDFNRGLVLLLRLLLLLLLATVVVVLRLGKGQAEEGYKDDLESQCIRFLLK